MKILSPEQVKDFSDPDKDGVLQFPGFVSEDLLEEINHELSDPHLVQWRDAHDTYTNARGLRIEQNHFTFALSLSRGDQSYYQRLDAIRHASEQVQRFVAALHPYFPSLVNWSADEMSIHKYDRELGLSRHRDNKPFIGVIAIASLEGECDLAVYRDTEETLYSTKPGDLILMRASKLIETDREIRPEHAVVNLRTHTRTSMMLRANEEPDRIIPGFEFANWQPQTS